ncbi:hypothetical protein [Hymenobacter antarcticus]|uniref:hypothetical protein n=1 Tax=Hymenobacter antarcticus TaxID=486270 RepID=UPI0031E8AA18
MNAPLIATLFVCPNPARLGDEAFSGVRHGGMKSDTYQFVALREEFRRHGCELATQDFMHQAPKVQLLTACNTRLLADALLGVLPAVAASSAFPFPTTIFFHHG